MTPESIISGTVSFPSLLPAPLCIVFDGIGELSPTKDITPLESVHICMMLACAQASGFVDYKKFINQHGLERHFNDVPR